MSTTPTPWTALPAPPDLGYPDGAWLVVGPRTDEGESHTIAVCLPCGDGPHPAERAWLDAQLIVARANSTTHLAEALIRESHANVHLVTPADVMVISGFRGGIDEITTEVLAGIHAELRKGGIRYLLMFEDEVDVSKLTADDLRDALKALES